MTELVLANSSTDLAESTVGQITALRDRLSDLTPDELHGAIIWAEAIAAAGKAKRAWEIAREACELQVRAQRQLGDFLNRDFSGEEIITLLTKEGVQSGGRPHEIPSDIVDEMHRLSEQGLGFSAIARELNERGILNTKGKIWNPNNIRVVLLRGKRRSRLDPKEEGAYQVLALMPEDLFDTVTADLLERGKSVDARTVIRAGRQQSLELVEHGIFRSWDGLFFTRSSGRTSWGGYRRSTKRTLEEVREELYEQERLTTKKVRTGPTKLLDEAFAEARRDAQALNQLRESDSFYPEVRDLIGEAELMQSKVASLLYEAYRQFKIQEKNQRPFKMPPR